jgi:hypothetical protein
MPPYAANPYSGMVDLTFTSSCTLFNPSAPSMYTEAQAQAAQRYFVEVILPDEQRFWDRNGKQDASADAKERTEVVSLAGVQKKVIVDGKIVIDLSEEVMKRWARYDTGLKV